MHKAVSAVIIKDGKILIQNHVKLGRLTVPSGSVEEGEEPIDALVREMWEELNITKMAVTKTAVIEHKEINSTEYRYHVEIFEEPVNAEPEKHSELMWMSKRDVVAHELQPSLILADVMKKMSLAYIIIDKQICPILDALQREEERQCDAWQQLANKLVNRPKPQVNLTEVGYV